jgi:hypothetical protein
MKSLKILTIAILLFTSSVAKAQVAVNIHIGQPPLWGPVGYTEVRYYYLPAVEAYYDIQTSMFIYYHRGTWVHRAYLPTRYRNYDLYSGYKVVMVDYRGDRPYSHYKDHKRQYSRSYHGAPQKTFGNNPGRGNSEGKGKGHGNKNKNKRGH